MKRMALFVVAFLAFILALPIYAVFSFTNMPLLDWVAPHSAEAQTEGYNATDGEAYNGAITPGNTYTYGYCTYWAAMRRIQTGHQIPNNWGDAITWGLRATLAGYVVDHTPTVGSIYQWPQAPGGEGHVAYVESVDPVSGDWTMSEMNAKGWDVMNYRTYPAKEAAKYNFIHDRVGTLP